MELPENKRFCIKKHDLSVVGFYYDVYKQSKRFTCRKCKLDYVKVYTKTDRVRKMRNESEKKRHWKEKPHLVARHKMRYLINKGIVNRGNCRDCNKPNSEAHHTDYSKPFEVIWLCKQCHNAEHRRLRAEVQ